MKEGTEKRAEEARIGKRVRREMKEGGEEGERR